MRRAIEMASTRAGRALTALILETFRFNGRLLSAGDGLTKPLGLTSARWQVLGAIEAGPLSVAQIGRDMGLARQSVQKLADILEMEGMVQYEPNPNHQRAKLVCLTEKGRSMMRELGERQIVWANRIAGGAKANEIEAALGLVRQLRMRLEKDRV